MKRIKKHAKRKQKLRNIIMSFVFAILAITGSIYGINNYRAVKAEGIPNHSKQVLNNGDGTYTISLDVTGNAVKNYKKINVAVVLDISGSMDEDTNVAGKIITNSNSGSYTYYGKINGEFVQLTRNGGYGNYYYTVTSTGAAYNGIRYRNSNNPERLDAARTAIVDLADALLQNNITENVSDLIEMSLITFNRTANNATSTKVNNISSFAAPLYGLDADEGTNWEAGLKAAQNFNWGDNDTTYVIFVSDGNPTYYLNNNGSVGGSGYEYTDNMNTSYNQARPEAKNIVDAKKAAPNQTESKYEFYTIGIYGNANRMKNLANYAFTGNDNGTIPANKGTRYFAADDTAQLQAALNAILQDIQLKGFGTISIEDGTTNSISVSSGTDSVDGVIDVNEGSYKYYLTIPVTNNNDGTITSRAARIRTITKNNTSAGIYESTYTLVNDKNETYNNVTRVPVYVYDEDGNQVFDNNGNPRTDDTLFRIEWTKNGTTNVANPFYNAEVTRPDASMDSTTKAVNWNLESLGVLYDNVTYTVTFEVYPSQATLDLIADLKNGLVTYQDPEYAAANPKVWDYVICSTDANGKVTSCGVKTNTTATLKYKDTRDENPTLETSNYNLVEPVQTSAAPLLTVSKSWENGLNDGQSSRPINLIINRDGKERYTVSLPHENKWENTVAASVGIMTIHDGVVTVKTSGHEFSFSEPTNISYYWDLDSKTVRPMWINGAKDSDGNPVVTMLELQEGSATCTMPSGTDDATCTSGSDTFYRIGGKIYKVNNQLTTLNTTNYRRSNLNVKKVVDGADAPADALFEFTITINDSTIEGPNSEDKVWFAIYDENNERVLYSAGNAYVSGANATPEILSLKAKEGSLRNIHNNGDGTYSYEYYEYNEETEEFEWTPYTITQVGVDADGNPTYYSGSYKADDASALTIKLKKDWYVKFFNLPKDTTYDVNENTMPENFNFVSAKLDGTDTSRHTSGTIASNNSYELVYTNKYELMDITVNKIWTDDDNQDNMRGPVTIVVKDGNNTVKTVTLEPNDEGVWTEETLTHTFTGLTRFRDDGTTEIEYTVVETVYPEGYEPQTPVKEENAEGKTIYTIENIHESAKVDITVEKVWDDNNDQDGTRPDSVTINLMGDTKQVGTVTFSKNAQGVYETLTHTFEDMPVNNAGKPIEYSVVEVVTDPIKGKTADVAEADREAGKYYYSVSGDKDNGFIVTNTLKAATVDVTINKVWDDKDNQDGIRPNSVTIYLKANNNTVEEITLTANAEGVWTPASLTRTLTGMPKNSAGSVITYSIEELVSTEEGSVINGNEQTGYKPSYSASGQYNLTVKNTHNTEVTSISGEKRWVDTGNENLRPDSVTINLVGTAKNTSVVNKSTNASKPNWEYAFDNLPVYYQGERIEYTVSEAELPEYTTTKDGNDFTNTLKTIDIPVEKVWDDNNDQDGTRPDSVTINLKNGTETVDSVTFSKNDAGVYEKLTDEFTNLPLMSGNKEIQYTVEEVTTDIIKGTTAVAEADREAGKYYYSVAGDKTNGFTVTNTLKQTETEVTVNKVWSDNNNQDGTRPDEITINLKNGTETVDSVVFKKDATTGKWPADSELTHTFTRLPKNSNGQEIEYTVEEVTTDVIKGTTAVAEADREAGKYYYSVSGDKTNGFTVTNTLKATTTNIPVEKVWSDNNNQDGVRPNEVTIKLMNGTEKVDEVTLKANENGEWTEENLKHTFTGLPMNNNGTPIEYTVEEVTTDVIKGTTAVAEADRVMGKYYYSVSGDAENGFKVTNTLKATTIDISVQKIWKDNNNQDGLRPDSITINLMVGNDIIDSVTFERDATTGEWPADSELTHTFTGLPKNSNGQEIQYQVVEEEIENYQVQPSTALDGTHIITNKWDPEKTDITVEKVWADNNNQDGVREDSVTINLLADNKKVDEVTLNSQYGWSHTFEDKPKYRDGGVKIEYTVEEVKNGSITDDGTQGTYTIKIEKLDDEGYKYKVTNTLVPTLTSVSGTKTWSDNGDQDGIRPDSIEIKLYADGQYVTSQTVNTNGTDEWTYTFSNLPKYHDGGITIEYTVGEDDVTGYTSSCDANTHICKTMNITNTHTPETVDVVGKKTWVDLDDIEGFRPENITVYLLQDEVKIAEKTVDATKTDDEGSWLFEFTGLTKYHDGGKAYKYTIEEKEVPHYEDVKYINDEEGNPYIIVNTHSPSELSITVEKVWDDVSAEGIENLYGHPEEVEVKLTGTVEIDDEIVYEKEYTAIIEVDKETGDWKHTFTELPEYREGMQVSYTATEITDVENYEPHVTTDKNKPNTYIITNKYTPEYRTNITGTKTWKDENDNDGIRPDSIELVLTDNYENEVSRITVTPDEKGNWNYEFTNLPAMANGEEIIYTLSEVTVDGYEVVKDGYNLTNTHEVAKVSFDIVKIWSDDNNNDGLRPDSITVKAVNAKTGEVVATAEVKPDENGDWHYEFKDLNKYKDGELIEYKIIEEAVAGYTNTVVKKTTDESTTYEITNTHENEFAKIRITKEWDDTNDAAMLRPSEITVDIFVGTKKVKTVIITEADGWEITVTDLPKYADGEEIEYRIEEHEITEYDTTITKTEDGFHILNHHELGKGNGEDPEELPPQTGFNSTNARGSIIYIVLTILSIIGINIEFLKNN